jgi:hypothetical protein
MNTSQSIEALQRTNPRGKEGFAESVEAAADAVRTRVATPAAVSERRTSFPRRRFMGVVCAALVLATAAVTALWAIGSPGAEDATAAVKKAATLTQHLPSDRGLLSFESPATASSGRGRPSAGMEQTSLSGATRPSAAAGPARSSALSTESSTASSPAAVGSRRASRRTSIRAAARLPTSTSPPYVRTSGGSRYGGSPVA